MDLRMVMDDVDLALAAAKKYGLELEVMASAFIALKEDPNLSIVEALGVGLREWDVL